MERSVEELKKQRGGFEQVMSLPIDAERAKIEVEGRSIKGYAIVWGSKNSFNEIVLKGATANSLNARGVDSDKNKILLLNQHRQDQILSAPTVLKEDDFGLYFEAEIIEGTQVADEALAQIEAGVLRQLSYGFNYVWDKTEWDENEEAWILREIKLHEISLVTFSADENAQLRNFGEYQKTELLKVFTPDQLRNLKQVLNTLDVEESRDEHSQDEQEEQKSNNKPNFF